MLEAQHAIVELRKFLGQVYNETGGQKEDLKSMSDAEIIELASNLKKGVPMATPVFDGASEEEIKNLLTLADLPTSGQTTLHDGRTGEQFERPVTVGYMYMLKLNRLVDDKMQRAPRVHYRQVASSRWGGRTMIRRSAFRRNGSVGVGGLWRRVHLAGNAHGQVGRRQRTYADVQGGVDGFMK